MLRKREALFLPALLLAIAFSVTGCGSSEDTTTASQEETTQEETVQEEVAEEPQIPDLTGQWEQVNKSQEGDAAYHTAVITDDTITIDWIMDDTTFLYWAGTFTAPQTADEPYTWDSENDKEKTGSALLASGDDIKAFTYENNQISYEASAMGETMTVYLEKTADLEPAQQEEVAQEETKVEVVSENLLKYTSYNSGYATYLAEIKNTGTTSVYIHNVSVDVEDMNGSLLKSEEFISAHPNVIAPGESAYICSNVITSLDEVNLDNVGKAILHYDADETSTAEKLNVELSEVSIKANSYGGYAVMGRATNTGTEDLEYFYIGGDIRDGNGVLQNYVYTSIDSLKAGETKGFEASILWGPDVDYSGSAVNLTVYD